MFTAAIKEGSLWTDSIIKVVYASCKGATTLLTKVSYNHTRHNIPHRCISPVTGGGNNSSSIILRLWSVYSEATVAPRDEVFEGVVGSFGADCFPFLVTIWA